MKKSELIRKLHEIPGDPEVVDSFGFPLASVELNDESGTDVVTLDFEPSKGGM